MLTMKEGEKWIQKHSKSGEVPQTNRKHLEFAKNLFLCWNDDGSGLVSGSEVLEPLTALGLSQDSKFVKLLIGSLQNRSTSLKELTDLKLDIVNFVKLFKSDPVSETIANVVKSEIRKEHISKLHRLPRSNYTEGFRNFTIGMKTEDE